MARKREGLASAFGPDQLREGAKSTGGQVGVLYRTWEPHPDGLLRSLRLMAASPSKAGLEAQGREVKFDALTPRSKVSKRRRSVLSSTFSDCYPSNFECRRKMPHSKNAYVRSGKSIRAGRNLPMHHRARAD